MLTLQQRVTYGRALWIALVEAIFGGWFASWLIQWTMTLFTLPEVK